ncbi:hypothetical protein [Ekhidna sp.]|uniref:hypothetical protein n=1 Tax=Ekhidna sp. TaxID=2608089 RepID=UPI0032975D84
MKTGDQKSKDTQVSDYYDQALSTETSCFDISQYDTSLDYINDTWYIEERNASNMRAQLEEFMEGDTEFIAEFARYISINMENLENQLPDLYFARNLEAFKRLKHMLKPTIEMVGDYALLNDLNLIQNEWQAGEFQQSKILRVRNRAKYINSQLKIVIANSGREAA